MNFMPNGISQKEAICKACDEVGGKTSLKELSVVATKFYGATIDLNTICAFRKHWQRKNNKESDCRTYKGQPRRNMLNDNRISKQQAGRLGTLSPGDLAKMLKLIGDGRGKFHSIPQLANAIRKRIIENTLATV